MTAVSILLSTHQIFLSPEERFDVWQVKAAERPHLLETYPGETILKEEQDESNPTSDQDDSPGDLVDCQKHCDEKKEDCLPLTDGCDIMAWRQHAFIRCGTELEAVSQTIGVGSTMLRRESCLPLVKEKTYSSVSNPTKWEELKRRLMKDDQCNIEQIHYSSTECHPLIHEVENRPVLIHGCTDEWPSATTSCRFQELVDRFGDMPWRFSDTHGETMSLRTYYKYCFTADGQLDDAPLGVYDSQMQHDERRIIFDEYTVPQCFQYDLFDYLSEEDRPPYRWILIGPERSGTGLHIDPVGTHAWVTLVEGCKRWVLFPPQTPADTIHLQTPQIPSSIWFGTHHESVCANVPGCIQVVQRPGETVYVPAGWPHLVLNLECSTAITQNYATEYPSIHQFFTALQEAGESILMQQIRTALQQQRPDLVPTDHPEDDD